MAREWRPADRDGGEIAPGAEPVLVGIAARQEGVVGRAQLLGAGVTERQIDRRIASGLLVVLWPGVYALGHARLRPRGHRLGVLLACGPDAALSHRSAAHALGLLDDHRAVWDVTLPPAQRKGGGPAGLRLHRAALDLREGAGVGGVRVTSIAR